jgi:hypothetical protein
VDRELVFTSVLLVCLCASAVVVWYFARHNPNPHFRPRFGEIVMVSIMALGISGGVSFFLSGVLASGAMFEEELDLNRPSKILESRSGGTVDDPDAEKKEKPEESDKKPPFPWMRGRDK